MKPTLLSIDLLQYADDLKLKQKADHVAVMDPCRKKFVKLEPEEFVRQLVIIFLHDELNIGYGRMISEQKLHNYQQNRFDLGVRNTDGSWQLLVECKSFRGPLKQDTVIQLAKYNTELGAKLGMISNGRESYVWLTGPSPSFISEQSDLFRHISS